MTRAEAAKLQPGLYVVYWKKGKGGSSLAAIGQQHDGESWLAPANWLSPRTDVGLYWRMVESVRQLFSSAQQIDEG